MAAYMIISYDVSDADRFKDYNPGSLPGIFETVTKHGGSIIGAGPADVVEGTTVSTTVLISFPDADAAKAWASDDDYAPLKAIRYESTTNITEYIIPSVG